MPKLSKSDEKFLRDVGISPQPITSHDEEILALPKRGQMDLLTRVILDRLVKQFTASAEDNE